MIRNPNGQASRLVRDLNPEVSPVEQFRKWASAQIWPAGAPCQHCGGATQRRRHQEITPAHLATAIFASQWDWCQPCRKATFYKEHYVRREDYLAARRELNRVRHMTRTVEQILADQEKQADAERERLRALPIPEGLCVVHRRQHRMWGWHDMRSCNACRSIEIQQTGIKTQWRPSPSRREAKRERHMESTRD
jgi:hypothetical protein